MPRQMQGGSKDEVSGVPQNDGAERLQQIDYHARF